MKSRIDSKKLFATACLVVLMMCSVFSGAAGEDTPLRVAALKGPTGMALAHMMVENKGQYVFTLAGAPDELTGQLIAGNIDIAAVPTNLASVLYNKTGGKIKALSLITGGMLYVLEKGDSVHAIQDLNGKDILSAGQGAAPEYVFGFILKENGITCDVTYSSEQAEVISLAVAGKADIVVLPEPHVTTLLSRDPSYRVALDITALFGDAAQKAGYENAGLHMSCIVVRSEVLQKYPEKVSAFLQDLQASVRFALDEPALAAGEIAQCGIIPSEEIALRALPGCALTYIAGDEMGAALMPMLSVLYDANPAAVGGRIPEDDFFAVLP